MEVIFALIKKTKVNLNIISQNKIDKLIDLPDK